MKRETAERLAATVVSELSVDDARRVISEFLRAVAECPVCGGTGEYEFAREVEFLPGPSGDSGGPPHRIEAGRRSPCPTCRGTKDEEPVGDPEYVAWHCARGDDDHVCRQDRSGDKRERVDNHARCGWRIMLPLQPQS